MNAVSRLSITASLVAAFAISGCTDSPSESAGADSTTTSDDGQINIQAPGIDVKIDTKGVDLDVDTNGNGDPQSN